VTAFVLRDASDRFRIERPDAFVKLLRLVAGATGSLNNRAELAAILGIAATTVDDYLSILEESHILRRIRPFIGGKRAELTKTPRTYFIDNGLRNSLTGNLGPFELRADHGPLLENWVFSELHKRFPEPGGVRYWRTRNGAEVDFVVEPDPGTVVPIEVKAASGAVALSRSSRSFIEAYEPGVMLVVYRGGPREQRVGSTVVRWMPAHDLPHWLSESLG